MRLVFLLVALAPSALYAQAVMRGRVVDEVTLAPVPGAIVAAFDESGGPSGSAFADATGAFVLPPLSAGAYLVTVEMIGRRSLTTQIALARTDFFVLKLPSDPIRLDGIDVSVPRRCSAPTNESREISLVWGEVQKALRAASLTRTQAMHEFRVRVRDRLRDMQTGTLFDEGDEEHTVTAFDPFDSRAPEDLAARGYVVEENGEPWIYGPSIEVLLSRAFQDTHCFALRRDRRRQLIGLSFEPIPGGRLSDIEGVLWLAEATGELRTLEFSYVRLPSSVPRGKYEGFARFRRLDGGAWTIDQWRLSALDMHDPMRVRERTGQLVDVRRLR